MKKYIYFILYSVTTFLTAQTNHLVEYNFVKKDGYNDVEHEYLVFNENEIFYANLQNPNRLNFEDDKLEKVNYQYEPIYVDLKKDSIYQMKIGIFNPNSSELKRFVAGEVVPKISWKISKESLKILNYTCYKATTTFRGREYTAWFTPELPFNYGPWKLQGLPGLILKADTELFSYEAKRIVLNSDKIPRLNDLSFLGKAKVKHTMRESFDYENNWLENMRANIYASLPPGAKIQEKPLRGDVRELTLDE